MGCCHSVFCSSRTAEKSEKKVEKEEIEETPVVEIHLNCPTNTVSRESPLELRQEPGPAEAAVSSSMEVLDFESDEQSLSETSSFLSEDECDVAHPQDLQEDLGLGIRGRLCLPRNMKITGLGPQNGIRSCGLAPVENPTFSSSKNEGQFQQRASDDSESSNWTKERPGPSGYHSTPNISLPLPRPSQWQQLYSQELKEKEKLADENLKRKLHRNVKKKAVSLEEKVRARSIRLIKKIKKSMRLKAAQDPNSGPAALPPDEAIAAMFGVTVEDCRDSSTTNSPGSSRASSRLVSSASHYSSIALNESAEEDSLEGENNGRQSGRKSRKWFRLRNNKVAPL